MSRNNLIVTVISGLKRWSRRRWCTAFFGTIIFYVVIAVPSDIVDTSLFNRKISPEWWSNPVLILNSVLTGLLLASYINAVPWETTKARGGIAGALATFLAVGCPICNKLVVFALGTSGALRYFQPFQMFLAVLFPVLLFLALFYRIRGEKLCPTSDVRSSEHQRFRPKNISSVLGFSRHRKKRISLWMWNGRPLWIFALGVTVAVTGASLFLIYVVYCQYPAVVR